MISVVSSKSDLGFRTFFNLEGHKFEIKVLGMKKWSLDCYIVLSKLEIVLKCSTVESKRMA